MALPIRPPTMTGHVLLGRGPELGDPNTRPLSVLLVEQQPSDRLMGQRMLEAAGHQVQAVGDWNAALGILARVPLDALLLDVRCPAVPVQKPRRGMPPNDQRVAGIKLLRGWPPPLGNLPLLAIVGRTEPGLAKLCQDSGADGLLLRPLEPEAVLAMLRRCVVANTPPIPLDYPLRKARRAAQGDAAVDAADTAAMEQAGEAMRLIVTPPGIDELEAAAQCLAEAADRIAAPPLGAAARQLLAAPERRKQLLPDLLARLMATRVALRREVRPRAAATTAVQPE